MNNIIVMTLIAITASLTIGCDVHNYPDGTTVYTPAGHTPRVVVVADPYEEVYIEETIPVGVMVVQDVCDYVHPSLQANPYNYPADWCFETYDGIQCEWYIGNNGPYGCWESWTFYDAECQWFYQYDYCE